MRHRVRGKQLSRNTGHRRSLRRNMAASLFEHGTIRTTVVKAKEIRPWVEQLITIARQGTLHARRRVIALLRDRAMASKEDPDELAEQSVVQKLFSDIAPRYVDRPGGYTRIIHLPERRIGDAGRQVLLQLVQEAAEEPKEEAPKAKGKGKDREPAPAAIKTKSARRARAARRAQAAKEAQAAHGQASAPAEPATAEAPAAESAKPEGEQPAK